MTEPTGRDLADAVARNLTGKPLVACSMSELCRVRDDLAAEFDAEIFRRQAEPLSSGCER